MEIIITKKNKELQQNCLINKWIIKQTILLNNKKEIENIKQFELYKYLLKALISKD